MKTKSTLKVSRIFGKKAKFNIFITIILAISAIALAWFLTWYRTNFYEQAAGRYPRKVKVLVLKYLPDGANATHETFIQQQANKWKTQMENASKFHGYQEGSTASPLIEIVFREGGHITRYEDPPLVQGSDMWDTSNKSFKAIVEANNNEICNIINTEGIDQVWYALAPDGVNNGGYIGEWYWSHSFGTVAGNQVPLCGGKRSFVSLTLNTETKRPLILETFGHYMEMMVSTLQTEELFQGRFAGTGNIWGGNTLPPIYTNAKVCGDVHYSPNAIEFNDNYDYYQPEQALENSCEDWHPNYDEAQHQTVTSANWKCSADQCSAVDYLNWWFNNMPGKDVNLQYQGRRLPPWFDFLSDMDGTIAYYAGKPEYFLAPAYYDAGLPSYISYKSIVTKDAAAAVTWKHSVSGTNRLLVVTVAYRTWGDSETPKLSNVTFDTTPLTFIRRDRYKDQITEMWYLKNPATGIKNITATFSTNNENGGIIATGTTFVGVDQTNPIRKNSQGVYGDTSGVTDAYSPYQAGSQSVAIHSEPGDFVFAMLNTSSEDNVVSRGANTAGIWGATKGDIISKGGVAIANSALTQLNWTSTMNWQWGATGIAIKPKGAETPTPTPTVVPVTKGLTGKYYDTKNFTGTLMATRVDPIINFNWQAGKPHTKVAADTFSVRWTGFVLAPVSGVVTFYAKVDDGVRLWIGTTKVIDSWTNKTTATEVSGKIKLVKNQKYPIKLDYYENTKNASITLLWAYTGVTKRLIPGAALLVK